MVQTAERIRNWAQVTNWTQPFIITHKLYLKRTFGADIRKAAVELEAQGKCGLAKRAESVFETLRQIAGRLDTLCNKGLHEDDDYVEFEYVRKRLTETANELADVLARAAPSTGLRTGIGGRSGVAEKSSSGEDERAGQNFKMVKPDWQKVPVFGSSLVLKQA